MHNKNHFNQQKNNNKWIESSILFGAISLTTTATQNQAIQPIKALSAIAIIYLWHTSNRTKGMSSLSTLASTAAALTCNLATIKDENHSSIGSQIQFILLTYALIELSKLSTRIVLNQKSKENNTLIITGKQGDAKGETEEISLTTFDKPIEIIQNTRKKILFDETCWDYPEKLRKLIDLLHEQGRPFHIQLIKPRGIKNPSTERIISYFGTTFISENQETAKRTIDITLSAILIVLLSPIMIITAIAIKLTSTGPIIFKQTRSGRHGKPFQIYKFRTMVEDAEKMKLSLENLNELNGPVFKIKQDPRITKIGKTLRKYSIDELPQLLNVLIGNMSLVGPRPPLPEEVSKYENFQRRRLSVKPGITCTWQISGRNEISFEKWIELDLKYIDNYSTFKDLSILLKTLPAVLRAKGAS